MNLTKIAINLNKFEGSAKKYVHGISEGINAASKLSNVEIMMWQSKGSNISISEYLLKILEDPVPAYAPSGSGNAVNVKVMDLLRDCIGVNRTYSEMCNVAEHFYKVRTIECYTLYEVQAEKLKAAGIAINLKELRELYEV